MTLRLQTSARLFDLHASVGLTDWDMKKELKQLTTMDQFHYGVIVFLRQVDFGSTVDEKMIKPPKKDEVVWYDESADIYVKPSLWLVVNPYIACPIQYSDSLHALPEPVEETCDAPLQEELLQPASSTCSSACSSTEYMVEYMSGSPPPTLMCPHYADGQIMVDGVIQPPKSKTRGRKPKATAKKTQKAGVWPRPPVNYCILIALALKTGCLKVQQIYHFTREHFPFFQTAPDGWKNTIRHNLCFNSSFHKTVNQLGQDGKRKSCSWHLTLDGHQRLEEDLRSMKAETLRELERSMAHPDIIRRLLA